MTKEILYDIFKVYGNIKHIQMPYYKNSKVCKGFAFLEYFNRSEAESAKYNLNNLLPKKIVELAQGTSTSSLKVLLKEEWEVLK